MFKSKIKSNKYQKTIKYILIAVILCSISSCFISCSDDDDDYKGTLTESIVPSSIKYSDEIGRTAITFDYSYSKDSKRITSYTVTNNVNGVLEESILNNYTILYDNDGRITGLMNGDSLYYTYRYSKYEIPEDNIYLSEYDELWEVTKIQGEYEPLKYLIDKNGNPIHLYRQTYNNKNGVRSYFKYSGKNIVKVIYFSDERDDLSNNEIVISYNNQHGIFKNVTTPKWFIATEIEEFAMYQLSGNISNSRATSTKSDQYTIGEFTYNSLDNNFPSRIQLSIKSNNPVIDGLQRQYEIVYNQIY